MGQKANPKALRLGIVEDWESTWYSEKNYGKYIMDDILIRSYLKSEMKNGGVSSIKIYRSSDKINVVVRVTRAGVVLGKGGENVNRYTEYLSRKLSINVSIKVLEQADPEKNAKVLANSVCSQLERRVPFRRAMKMAVQWAMKSGAKGIRINSAGRLGGAEIARTEWYLEGKVPLHTLRADIDYAFSEAITTYGKIGVKVWVYNGDVIDHNKKLSESAAVEASKEVAQPQG